MRKKSAFLFALLLALFCTGCAPAAAQPQPTPEALPASEAESEAESGDLLPDTSFPGSVTDDERGEETGETGGTSMEKTLRLRIDDTQLDVDWEENESVDALIGLVSAEPLSVQMSMYGGFEQVGPLGTSLPRNDVQTATQAGDVVLYAGNQIVVFYGPNSWAYTRLGRIRSTSAEEMRDLLANGNVVITLYLEEGEET